MFLVQPAVPKMFPAYLTPTSFLLESSFVCLEKLDKGLVGLTSTTAIGLELVTATSPSTLVKPLTSSFQLFSTMLEKAYLSVTTEPLKTYIAAYNVAVASCKTPWLQGASRNTLLHIIYM